MVGRAEGADQCGGVEHADALNATKAIHFRPLGGQFLQRPLDRQHADFQRFDLVEERLQRPAQVRWQIIEQWWHAGQCRAGADRQIDAQFPQGATQRIDAGNPCRLPLFTQPMQLLELLFGDKSHRLEQSDEADIRLTYPLAGV